MASVLPNFEYDIFISYRHKDNKYDGWITEFIDNLKKELEATFKEDISIYFDVNPHDGLLETHDVGGSLKDKLKCLVFIPIISRTYCDTKSFAWNNEFLEFLKSASTDTYGLKVKLPNGNTASRVLPIRIHELDAADKRMIETELEGPLRAIDFTFHAAGVNRPLRPKDDESSKGPGQASYRDQINKTANAIRDLMEGIQGRGMSDTEGTPGISQQSTPPPKQQRKLNLKLPALSRFQIAVGGFILSMILLVLLSVVHFSETNHSPTYKTTILPPNNIKFDNDFGGNIALSPDGTMIAFVALDSSGNSLLYVRPLNAMEARALKGTEKAKRPFWSPDNRFIGFFVGEKLKKVDIAGGPVLTLCDANLNRGGSWNQDDIIIFSTNGNNSISSVSANGGTSTILTRLDSTRHEASHRWPVFLPDGKHFFFIARVNALGTHPADAIFVASLDSSFTPKMIVKASSSLAFTNDHLLYYREGNLVAHLFDVGKLEVTGDPTPIADQVNFEALNSNAAFSVSQNGLLAYQNAFSSGDRTDFVWYSRNGRRLSSFSHSSIYYDFQIAPDGQTVAIKEFNVKKDGQDIWLYEINRDAWKRFTNNGRNFFPVWSPDSKMIVYASYTKNASGNLPLYIRAASGAGAEESIFETPEIKYPTDWSRDGGFIAYNKDRDIWILPMNTSGDKSGGPPFPFLQTEFLESGAVFSPDGRWIAYRSFESGSGEIYIRPFPGPGGKWQVTTRGGYSPRWRGDGKELFFRSPDSKGIMSVEIKASDAAVTVGVERLLLQFEIGGYDVTSDGQKFLVATQIETDTSVPITLVVNWLEELKRDK